MLIKYWVPKQRDPYCGRSEEGGELITLDELVVSVEQGRRDDVGSSAYQQVKHEEVALMYSAIRP